MIKALVRSLIFGCLFLIVSLLLAHYVSAEDIAVWQGQYYTGTTFNTGTYEFNFTVYDAPSGGGACYSNVTQLTTGSFGEWKTEQSGVNSACNNVSKDYFLNININGVDQTPRRRLLVWNSLRKDVNETTRGTLESSSQIITPIIAASQIISKDNELKIGTPIVTQKINESGSARYSFQNVNSENTSNTLFSVINNAGYFLSFGLTSSNYFSVQNNRSFSNQPSIGQSSFNDMYFVNGRYTGFSWLNNPLNDTSNIVQTIMHVDNLGNLNVSQNITLGDQIVTNGGCLIPHSNFWAERAGTITSGGAPAGLQYSFGDGNTDGGPTQPCSGKIVYLSVHAQNAVNGNGKIDMVINKGVNSTCNIATPLSDDGTTQTNCNLNFNAGDTLTPRTTITPTGTNNGYVVAWWVVYD